MSPLELATACSHQGNPWRQRLCHVAQVGGEKEQGKYSQADEGDEAPGQHQQGVNVVSIADILRLLAVVVLDQVTVLHPLCNLESIFTHLPGAEVKTGAEFARVQLGVDESASCEREELVLSTWRKYLLCERF